MARRDVTDFRTVVQVLAEEPDQAGVVAANLGQDIIRRSQEARIKEGLSAAMLEMNAVTDQFQKQYEGDPFSEQGLKELKEQRQAVLDTYGQNISPLFRRDWQEGAMSLSTQHDTQINAWGYKQATANTRTSITNTGKNYLNQAMIDGEAFGTGKGALVETLANFGQAKKQLEDFGTRNLGEVTTGEYVKAFGQDWVKSFVSGVAKNNPVEALRLMDSDEVKTEIEDQADFMKFREAIETRAIKFQEVAKQQEILDVLKNENALLASGKVLSYGEITDATAGMSEGARDYFLRANGYKKDGDEKLSMEDKLQFKAGVYDQINQLALQENVAPADIVNLQDAIYNGMNQGALSQEEGANFLTQLLDPAIAEQEKQLGDFTGGDYNPFKENVGLEGIQKHYADSVEIKVPEGEEVGTVSKAVNAANKAQLYDNYFSALDEQAAKRGIKIADIPNQRDSYEVYQQAQAQAIQRLQAKTTPVLKLQPAIPISAIVHLTKNPTLADKFDEKYGKGSANRILGR